MLWISGKATSFTVDVTLAEEIGINNAVTPIMTANKLLFSSGIFKVMKSNMAPVKTPNKATNILPFRVFLKMISDQETLDASNSLDIISIGSIYQKSGNLSLSEGFYRLGLGKGLPKEIDCRILRNFAIVMKKQNKWLEAIKLWELAAQKKDSGSCIEIAKYYEHHTHNYHQAKEWVEEAMRIVESSIENAKIMSDLEHRKRRLESKINTKYEE